MKVCDFADGEYERPSGWRPISTGAHQRDHGTHEQDIVPAFTIENPRPDDPPSFPGQNWDERGQAIYNAGCEEPAPPPKPEPEPERKVRICHATSSNSNPYTSNEPAIANNGDLNGGHLDHTGPVYPAKDWGDIIPPYPYVDKKGKLQTFPGYNWSPEGQAIYQNGCEPPHPPDPPEPKPITPILECVENLGGGKVRAHFGYIIRTRRPSSRRRARTTSRRRRRIAGSRRVRLRSR